MVGPFCIHSMYIRHDVPKTDVDDIYAFSVASDVVMNSDPEPQSVEECRHRDD